MGSKYVFWGPGCGVFLKSQDNLLSPKIHRDEEEKKENSVSESDRLCVYHPRVLYKQTTDNLFAGVPLTTLQERRLTYPV